jgi:PKHD-type hydroxylase|tara:strand:- start:69 stop:647 length:579 start_codon:yes stop_codon:yes gene_type:complete
MLLKNSSYFFKSAISNDICDKIVEHGLSKPDQEAKTFDPTKQKRNSNVSWLNEDWIFNQVMPFFDEANKTAEWNFDLEYLEPFQFTKYDGSKKQHYDWHIDAQLNDHEKLNGMLRKLSMTVNLTDESTYEGGNFEFKLSDPATHVSTVFSCEEIRPKGTVLVFPSHLLHRVLPVTSGIRYSLVVWAIGKPFR